MKRHGLAIALALTLVLVTVPSVYWTWVEFRGNEQHGVNVGHADHIFWAYLGMQVGLNIIAEIVGLLIMTTYTKRLYEQGSAESK